MGRSPNPLLWAILIPMGALRLVVNADDFGRSQAVNKAVIQSFQQGILTTASLMVNEPAADEAIEWAHQHPRLGVGLHLSLARGRSALPSEESPLADPQGFFSRNPVAAGFRYFFFPGLRVFVEREIRAQLERFQETGLFLDHVNGHLNMQMHPVVLDALIGMAKEFSIRHVRVTRDLFRLNARLAQRRWSYRIGHAIVFAALSSRTRGKLARHGIRYTDRVIGLLQSGRMNEPFLVSLIRALPPGDHEIYFHPDFGCVEGREELQALCSFQVREELRRRGVTRLRCQDL